MVAFTVTGAFWLMVTAPAEPPAWPSLPFPALPPWDRAWTAHNPVPTDSPATLIEVLLVMVTLPAEPPLVPFWLPYCGLPLLSGPRLVVLPPVPPMLRASTTDVVGTEKLPLKMTMLLLVKVTDPAEPGLAPPWLLSVPV